MNEIDKKAGQDFRLNERLFSQLIKNSSDTFVILDEKGIQRYVSPSAERVHGYTPEELTDIPVIDQMIHPDDQEHVKAAFRNVVENGTGSAQYRHRRKSGGWVYLEAHGSSQLDNPDINGVIINVRDITEQKEAEEKQRNREEIISALIETSRDWIWTMNEHGIHTYSNAAIKDILGRDVTEITGTSLELMHPDDAEMVRKKMHEWVREKVGWKNLPVRFKHKDGTWRYLESSSVPTLDSDGNFRGFHGVDRDITERKLAEEALRESEERFRNIIELAPIAMAIVGMDQKIEYINRKAITVFGYLPEDIPTMESWWVQAYPDETYRNEVVADWTGRIVRALKEGGEIIGNAYQVTCKDGSLKMMFISGVPVQNKIFVMFDDITERWRAEEAKKLNEERLEALVTLNNMTDSDERELTHFAMEAAVSLTGSTIGYVAFMNEDESVLTMYAWSKQAMRECAISDKPVVYPVATTGLWGEAVRQRKAVITNNYEAPNPLKKGTPDGHVHVLRHMNAPTFDGGRIVLVAGVGNKKTYYGDDDVRQLSLLMSGLWSIIRRKRAEAELKKSEEKYRGLYNSLRDGSAAVDASGKITECNSTFLNMLGYSFEEVSQLSYEQITPPRWHESELKILREQVDVRGYSGLYEKEYVHKNGSVFPVELQTYLIKDNNGGHYGYWAIVRDITARKKVELTLKENEEKYRGLIETTDTGFVIIDNSGKVLDANKEYVRLSGNETLQQILGRSVIEWTAEHNLDKNNAAVKQCFENGYIRNLEIDYVNKEGHFTPVEINATRVNTGNNIIVLSICRDISERKKIETELLTAKVKSEFMANLSHEIRNPLNAIMGLNNRLSRVSSPDEQRSYIDAIRLSANNLMNILNDILDYSKIEANKSEMRPVVFSLKELIRETKTVSEVRAAQKGLKFSVSITEGLPDRLISDANKLRQIINNLIGNAIKFTHKGEVMLCVRSLSSDADTASIEFAVKDTGIGIRQEDYGKLFQSFTQIDSSTQKLFSGTGLGLSIVKSYTTLLGGFVTFESVYGKGSTFVIHIPFKLADENTGNPIEITQGETPAKIKVSKLNILLAEDDGINRMYLSDLLKSQDWSVETAVNGLEAVNKFKPGLFDLVILDGQMPVMDGFEASVRIKQIASEAGIDIPIMAITGYAPRDKPEQYKKAKIDDFVLKPVNENELFGKISEIIRK